MNFQFPIETLSNTDGPTFPLEVSSDKYYYVQGEEVVVTLTNVGDKTIDFLNPPGVQVVNSTGHIIVNQCPSVAQVVIPLAAGNSLTKRWDQEHFLCRHPGDPVPLNGEQVAPGRYKLIAGSGNARYAGEKRPVADSVWIEIGPGNSPPVADAGPDQTVYVGDLVQFDGSGSYDSDATLGWSIATPLPEPRRAPAVEFFDGVLFAIGGGWWNASAGNFFASSTNFAYNKDTGQWEQRSPMPKEVEFAGSAVMQDGIHILGGINVQDNFPGKNNHFVYQPDTDIWKVLSPSPVGGIQWAANVGGDLHIVRSLHKDHYVYDSKSGSWTQLASLPEGLWRSPATSYRGSFHIVGGLDGFYPNGPYPVGTHRIYNSSSDTWELLESMPTPRTDFGLTEHLGYLLAVGGQTVSESDVIDAVEAYDGATATWSEWPSLNVPRDEVGVASDGISLHAVGGRNWSGGVVYETHEILSPELSFSWDFGDGSLHGTGIDPIHVYTAPGIYNVTLTVTDAQGATDTDNCTITVLQSGQPPVADAGGPYFGSEGSPITLDASKSYDPDGDELEFRWDFENDGIWDSGWSSTDSVGHTWYDDFKGQVAVEVREQREVYLDAINDGEYKRYSFVDEDYEQAESFKPTQPILSKVAVDVSVLPSVEPVGDIILHIRKTLYGQDIMNSSLSPDVMPVGTRNPFSLWPRFDVSDINVTPGEQYFIVLTCPTCSKGYYHVEFSDDTYLNGTSFLKRPGSNSFTEYPDNDLRFATFWADLDTPRLSDKDVANVTVANVSPTPEWISQSADGTVLAPPYPEGKEIAFEATVSDPGIYDTFTYDWAFGDGVVILDAGPSVIHTYGDDKTYTVVLTVTDDDGGVGIDDTPPLPTTNEDPVPKIDLPFCIFVEGLDPCEAIGMFSDPGWLDTHSATWDFGDGTSEPAVLFEKHDPPASTGWNLSSHVYGDDGLYTITFTVTDDDGGSGTATAEVPVQNHPPSFDLYVPITVNEGEQFVLGVEATDPGSDDLTVRIDWGDGTYDSRTYYNDGIGPDPPNSGAGVFPFVVQANFTHVYPDDGDYNVTVEVEDDDGGIDIKTFQIPVLNVAPTVTLEVLPIEVNASLRIAGEKWHDVTIEMYEDGVLISGGTLVRYPGSPDDQRLDLSQLQVNYSKNYSAIVRYTPEDDPINGQPNGANPCWIILNFSDGEELWIHHTFNVQHAETHIWEVDLTAAILMHGLTFEATAFDPGADDLTFHWDFGDGTNATTFYPNVNETYPVEIMEIINHAFPSSGTYTVTVTVEDDDGGVGVAMITVTLP
jgi:PKD repeat protein